jgi:hypothetical protein
MLDDLCLLIQHLDAPEFSLIWSRLIALLVDWDPMEWALSDASDAGIGGCNQHSFFLMWRIAH